MACKHLFRFTHYSGKGAGGRKIKISGRPGEFRMTMPLTLGFRCDRCKESVERKATPKERAFHSKYIDWNRKGNVHEVWHEFMRRFKKDGNYILIGYDLMCRVEKWAAKHPRDVRFLGIDDSHFCGSRLVLVEHRTARDYMGTTVVVIPQCTGESPMEFFLYPHHRNALLSALVSIRSEERPVAKKQRVDETLQAKLTRKNLRHPPVI